MTRHCSAMQWVMRAYSPTQGAFRRRLLTSNPFRVSAKPATHPRMTYSPIMWPGKTTTMTHLRFNVPASHNKRYAACGVAIGS